MYQTIIIGGGPSGLMAAVAASEQNEKCLAYRKKERIRAQTKKYLVVVDVM